MRNQVETAENDEPHRAEDSEPAPKRVAAGRIADALEEDTGTPLPDGHTIGMCSAMKLTHHPP